MQTIVKPVVALAALAMVWFSAADASAFGRHRGGSSGGSWGSSGGSSGGYATWGSSGGSWGSSGGSSGGYGYHRVRRGHSSGGSWGSSGGSSGGYAVWGSGGGSWGSSGGSSGGYYYGGSSGGSSGGVIYDDGVPADAAPATPATPESPAPADAAEGTEGKSAYTGAGMLLVKVPSDAKIFVNGKATTSTGGERQYISRGLVRGASYNFVVKAELNRDGEPVVITKTAKLTAGGNAELTFDDLADEPDSVATISAEPSLETAASSEPLTTTLTVRVPSDARVFLAGNETKQTGEVREFSTNKLTAGEGWKNYTVRAEIEQDGKLITKEQLVTIDAGQSKEISFDFNDGPVAETAQK
jgi:uncharacterized protein (TIGR03000 family)